MEISAQESPAKKAILPFYLTAAFSFLLVNILTVYSVEKFTNHFFQPALLAITHLAVLGWGTMIIIGASNQLIPVVAEKKLYSNNLPVICFTLLLPGICLIVHSFWNFQLSIGMYIGAFIVLCALIMHSVNMFITSRRTAKSNVAVDFIMTAHAWLVMTAVLGIALLLNLRFGFLQADNLHYLRLHATLGMVGWFLLLVIGVSSRLLPMFLLSRTENKTYLNISWYLINGGLSLFLMEGLIFNSSIGKPLYTGIILSGVLFYLAYIRVCFTSALRKKLDGGMKQTLLAIGFTTIPFFLVVVSNLYIKDAPSSLIIGYGYSFFAGFISTLIMGQTFKTLPFIIWMHKTNSGKNSPLQPKDLYKEKLVLLQMLLYMIGFSLFLCGVLLKGTYLMYTGSAITTFAALLYFGHVVYLMGKLRIV
ncbi:MAG: hypothetical protein JST86_09345 [Bacteroidetes bacterium]|nr:hypothetical protein [Bacteroidota bacterium]